MVNRKGTKEQTIQWSIEKEQKNKQYNGQQKRSLTCDKSLKIPKGQSEYVYRRRTDNTMAKRRSTKGQI